MIIVSALISTHYLKSKMRIQIPLPVNPSLHRCTHLCTPSSLSFPTLLLVSLSSSWDEIGVRAPLTGPAPESVWVFAAFSGSAGRLCCGVGSALSLAPECRCFWRKQSWQREGSKMLGWNFGHIGSSPVGDMLGSSGSSHPVTVHSAGLFPRVKSGKKSSHDIKFTPNPFICLLCC